MRRWLRALGERVLWNGMQVVAVQSFRCKQIPEITDWQLEGLTKLTINPGKRVRTNLVNSPENRASVCRFIILLNL